MSVVIVGASLGGLRTAQSLRRRGYDETITLVGAESELPYDRPPLSKDFISEPDAEPPYLATRDDLEQLGVELMLSRRAQKLNTLRRRVELSGGDSVPYETLVVATGADPRRLPCPGGDLAGIHTLRTLADARALRDCLERAPRVVVVGGGFIGAEFASAARLRGLDVTMIERASSPFALSLGERVGTALGRIHLDAGVSLRTGVSVLEAHGTDHVECLTLTDGTRLDCDLVLVGVGVTPATSWLSGSDVAVGNGVLCDSHLRSVSNPDVFAVGDVASWYHEFLARDLRIEHWTNANEHADVVACNMTGSTVTASAVPYVWSDQFGRRLQLVGRPESGDRVHLLPGFEDAASGSTSPLSAAAWSREGVLTAALAVDSARLVVRARKAIQQGGLADDFTREHFPAHL